MKEDFKLIAGMLKCKLHMATMTQRQRELYDTIGKTYAADNATQTVTYTVPAGADEKDLRKVKKQLSLEGTWPITYIIAAPAPGTPPAPPPAAPKP